MEVPLSWLLLTVSSVLHFPVLLGFAGAINSPLDLGFSNQAPNTNNELNRFVLQGLVLHGAVRNRALEVPGWKGAQAAELGLCTSPASHGGWCMGLGDYWTICWLAVCILKYHLKANLSEFRMFLVSRSVTVTIWNAGIFFSQLISWLMFMHWNLDGELFCMKHGYLFFHFQTRNVRWIKALFSEYFCSFRSHFPPFLCKIRSFYWR